MPIKRGALIIQGNVDLSKVRVTEFQKRYPDQLNRYIRILEENPDDHLGVLLLKPSSDGYFEILDGHHRYLAYVMMGRAVAFALIVEERYIHDPRWNDPSFVQGIRDELAEEAGINANSPDRGHLRAEKERWTAQAIALEDIFNAFYAGSEKKRTNLFEKHTSLFVALQNAEPLFKTQE